MTLIASIILICLAGYGASRLLDRADPPDTQDGRERMVVDPDVTGPAGRDFSDPVPAAPPLPPSVYDWALEFDG